MLLYNIWCDPTVSMEDVFMGCPAECQAINWAMNKQVDRRMSVMWKVLKKQSIRAEAVKRETEERISLFLIHGLIT